MRWGVVWVEVFALVASYLILTLPAASATSVKIYGGQGYESATYNPWCMLDKDIVISPPWDSPVVGIELTNSTAGAALESVLLYRCRGMNPSDCISNVQADSSLGNLDSEFEWTSLADQTVSYPQQANVLVMARMNSGGRPFWTGSWIGIERVSEQSFDISEDDLGQVSIYVDDIEYMNRVKDFIMLNRMIPANPLWVSRIVLESALSIHELGFDEPGDIEGQEISGNEIGSVSEKYTFLLPEVTGILNPVVLYNNPLYICGDAACEEGLGESSSNCCLDCPCSAGWYCDIHWGCRMESSIALSMHGSIEPVVSNCYESHELDIPVEIQNPPSGMSLVSAWYSLRGDQNDATCVHVTDNVYTCPITVPAIDGCTEGVYTLGPNRIGVRISFPDGNQDMVMDLETGLPDITIGSFECGRWGCESELGETHENCCYDCPCPSGYCDYETGSPRPEAYCRQDPQEGDIHAASIEPDHFPVFSAGVTVDMNIVIGNAPSSLSVTAESCDLGCLKGGEPCTATCSVPVCSETASSPGEYNMSCMISLDIEGYDSGSDYVLSPGLGFRMEYNNGSGSVTKSMSRVFRDISVGAQRCGDMECVAGESVGSCCYDCPCPEGQYCDTRDISGPTTGDVCKPLSGTGLVIDDVGTTFLNDSTQPHTIKIGGHVPEPASGFAISGTCELANDPGIECSVYCQGTGVTVSGYEIECDISIPPFDHLSEAMIPYYDPYSRVLRFQPNSYNITVAYNDGPGKRRDFYTEPPLGVIEITVTSHCGEGYGDPPVMCEESLGETQETCCRDCGCSEFGEDFFCYTGETPNGVCLKNDTVLLEIIGFEPYPLGCTIGRIGGDCEFSQIDAYTHVINAPPDIEVAGASYFLEGQETRSAECSPGEGQGNFTCPIIPDSLEGTEGNETLEVNIGMDIRYHIEGIEVLQSINASREEDITRKKSQALESCENEISRLRRQIDNLESNADDYEKWAKIWHITALALFAAFVACMIVTLSGGSGYHVPPEGPVISLFSGTVIPPLDAPVNTGGGGGASPLMCIGLLTMAMKAMIMAMTADGHSQSTGIQAMSLETQLEQKIEMCSAEGFSDLADAMGGMMPLL